MGELLRLADFRIPGPEHEIINRILEIALRSLPSNMENAEMIARLTRLSFEWPARPSFHLTEQGFLRLHRILRVLRRATLLVQGEAFVVSRLRMRRETKWDPMKFLQDAIIDGDTTHYYVLQCMVGVIALAWQIQAHPRDVALTRVEYTRLSRSR